MRLLTGFQECHFCGDQLIPHPTPEGHVFLHENREAANSCEESR